ncbi:uncharacterized protein LOC8271693 [Ricinus communis]|uniref:Late embryogenesis abundant protein LEA-2 subgroup domain-containing protein n=1 Tax=Ricinus communis TaxID=3988 RepID=B9T0Q3_RICCO|nr:uncharacterized protein LOC8271693 [Ricinus communis]EEF30579.1 conserved hypothetical protein [Ricinus communis]|eukprot:XP_002531822.1 uncharacterized protein LOC8271693 [Ricinus communis]
MEVEKKAEETALNSTKDTEAQTQPKTKSKHRRRNICLAITASVIVLIVVIAVILAFTVFKAKEPTTTIDSISLENLKVDLDAARMGVDLNMTMDVDLTVTNPNKVGLKYKNGSALLNYRGELVGEVPIPAGKMGADETRPMNVTVTVMADRLLSNPQLFSDVMSGLLNVSTLIKLSGKVAIFNIFKISVDTTTTCDVSVFIANATIADQKCKYKAKI